MSSVGLLQRAGAMARSGPTWCSGKRNVYRAKMATRYSHLYRFERDSVAACNFKFQDRSSSMAVRQCRGLYAELLSASTGVPEAQNSCGMSRVGSRAQPAARGVAMGAAASASAAAALLLLLLLVLL